MVESVPLNSHNMRLFLLENKNLDDILLNELLMVMYSLEELTFFKHSFWINAMNAKHNYKILRTKNFQFLNYFIQTISPKRFFEVILIYAKGVWRKIWFRYVDDHAFERKERVVDEKS